jgi:hypothetical protein
VAVSIRYYSGVHRGEPQAFIIDVDHAWKAAHAANDDDGLKALRRLWLDHVEGDLAGMSAAALEEYLESRQIWRQEGEWLVVKTISVPCLTYVAQKSPSGDITLVLIAVCYQYPVNEDEWWNEVVRPRVLAL